MGKLRWYKRDPVAALEGMSNLSLEEVGAYNIVLDLIYARDGAVDDDDRFISGWMRCDVRVWRRIRARLLECKKLYSIDGALRNSRADAEVGRGLSMVASASEAGKASALKRTSKTSNNNKIAPTPVATTVPTNSTTTTTEELSLRDSSATKNVSREKTPKAKRAQPRQQLSEDWQPNERDRAFASKHGLTAKIDRMTVAFKRNHIGKGNQFSNWSMAWETWCENEIKFHGKPNERAGQSRATTAPGARAGAQDAIVAGMVDALSERSDSRLGGCGSGGWCPGDEGSPNDNQKLGSIPIAIPFDRGSGH